eukprot:COSAG06_NODE_226_length_19747_cov_9.234121_11_plen_87_part_00
MKFPYGYEKAMLSAYQTSPETERPCMPMLAVPEEPEATVTCARTASVPTSSDIHDFWAVIHDFGAVVRLPALCGLRMHSSCMHSND